MPKKVLVVDDEPDILKVMVFRLKTLGCEVTATASGREGLDLFGKLCPDVAVLDYRLPDIDGIEITRRVRADDRLKHTPIILISASVAGDIAGAAKKAGVNDYIIKPFDPEDLLAAVRKYL